MKHFAVGDKGERLHQLWKSATIRVFNIENRGSFVRQFRALPGCGYSAEAIDKFLEQVADEIERRFPGHEYKLVSLGEARFNFVWEGRRAAPANQEQAGA